MISDEEAKLSESEGSVVWGWVLGGGREPKTIINGLNYSKLVKNDTLLHFEFS